MDLSRLEYARRVATAAAIAAVALALLEAVAYWGFDESARDRNAFGFDRDTSFVVHGDRVKIETAPSRRFWPQAYAVRKPTDVVRVAAIGDSVFRGGSLEDSVTHALAESLSGACGARAEVWNLSSPGYGSQRKAVVAEKALEFSPDLLVYHAGMTTEYEDSREKARYTEFHSGSPRHWADHLPLLGRLKLAKLERLYWEWLPPEVRAMDERVEDRAAVLRDKFDTAYWTPRMLATMDGTVERARQARVPLLVLVHAKLDRASGRIDDFGLDATIRERYAHRPGVAVLSTREIFAGAGDPRVLFYDTSHWNPPGYELVAAHLSAAGATLLRSAGRCRVASLHRIGQRERTVKGSSGAM